MRSVVDTVIFKVEEKRERFPGGPVRRGGDLAFRLRPAADDSSVQAGFSVQSNGWAYISSCSCQATRMERKVVMISCLFFLQFFDVEYSNSFIRKVSGSISCAEACRLFLPLGFLIS